MTDAHGVRGWVKVTPYNDPRDSVLRSCRHWWFTGGGEAKVERARAHGAAVVCKLEGIEDRDAALQLRGREILVDRAEFPAAGADEFYWIDLVGCEVFDPAGRRHGAVIAVDDHGAHELLRVQTDGGREELVPFVDQWIASVDVAGKRIVTDWPFEA